MADVVYTGFDPTFRDPLNQLLARARAAGYSPNLISGVRSAYGYPGYAGQTQAELYAARGTPGGPKMAAPPGYSPHQYGVASDISGVPESWLLRNAPGLGLRAIAGDPGHVELANWQQEAANQPQGMTWAQARAEAAAGRPTQSASNIMATTPNPGGGFVMPGTTINAPNAPVQGALAAQPAGGGFYNSLVNIESGGKNIFSKVDKDYPGQPDSRSQGYAQIDSPTWQQFGAKAGIDLTKYPNAMSAPAAVQQQVASLIPLSRFGQRTQDLLAKQYGPLDTSMTVGQLDAKFGGGSTPASGTDGTATASNAPAAAPADQSWAQTALGKLTTPPTDAQGKPTGEKAPIDQITGALSGKTSTGQTAQEEAPQRPIIGAPGAHSAMMNPQAYAQMLATLQQPLTWGSRPLQGSGMAPAGQLGSAGSQVPGMTLNSFLGPSQGIGYGIPAVGYGFS